MCVIGPNGTGKCGVLKVVRHLLRTRAAAQSRTGRAGDLGELLREPSSSHGVVHVPQERSLFPQMSVWDNLLLGGFRG